MGHAQEQVIDLNALTPREYGQLAEGWVAGFLVSKGCVILARNFRAAFGELDVVARRGNWVYFVEVKARRSGLPQYGTPAEAVTYRKQRRIVTTASLFLERYDLYDVNIRYDVAEVVGRRLHYIKNAFDAPEDWRHVDASEYD